MVQKGGLKKGSGTFAGTAGHRPKVGRVLRTKVPDPFLNHAELSNANYGVRQAIFSQDSLGYMTHPQVRESSEIAPSLALRVGSRLTRLALG